MDTVLITGGAGFIGSHLADQLLALGHRVRVLDNLSPQVHGPGAGRPDYLHPDIELILGDVCDPHAVRLACEGADAVVHLAAAVGVGQSMYEVAHYTRVNQLGTAVLLERLIQQPVKKLLVASSMSVYGEGLYRDGGGRRHDNARRTREQLLANDWEVRDAAGQPLEPAPTPEDKPPDLTSVYALSKFDQERMCLLIGAAYNMPTVAMRFFNVYGPRQALSNPYTGVMAIFASRLLNGNRPLIFEDGWQRRDFVSVHDVARGCVLALTSRAADGQVLNIGSGRQISILQLARRMAQILDRSDIEPEVAGEYRVGDIRNCFADISLARRTLGFEPEVSLEDGLSELADWLAGQIAEDRVSQAREELAARGLTV